MTTMPKPKPRITGGTTKGTISVKDIQLNGRNAKKHVNEFRLIGADPRMGVVGLKPQQEQPQC